jgi:hypothetical protein
MHFVVTSIHAAVALLLLLSLSSSSSSADTTHRPAFFAVTAFQPNNPASNNVVQRRQPHNNGSGMAGPMMRKQASTPTTTALNVLEKPSETLAKIEVLKIDSDHLIHPLKEVSGSNETWSEPIISWSFSFVFVSFVRSLLFVFVRYDAGVCIGQQQQRKGSRNECFRAMRNERVKQNEGRKEKCDYTITISQPKATTTTISKG